MKAYVTHDAQGNIVSVNVANPDSEMKISVLPAEGDQVCEVTIDGKSSEFKDPDAMTRKLADVANHYRVSVPVQRGKLVKIASTRSAGKGPKKTAATTKKRSTKAKK